MPHSSQDDNGPSSPIRKAAEERWRRRRAQIDARMARPILTVGLTGGIASGKSTVDAVLAELGAHVIDADVIVHDLIGPGGAAVRPILDAFGAGVALPAGGIDRDALGAVVFRDVEARTRLEAIVHPLVNEAIALEIAEISQRPGPSIVVVDASLLVETGDDRQFDRLVVVTCREPIQVARLMSTRGIGREDAVRRVRAQLTSEDKAAHADYVIDNAGDLEATRGQARDVYRALLLDLERKRDTWNAPRDR